MEPPLGQILVLLEFLSEPAIKPKVVSKQLCLPPNKLNPKTPLFPSVTPKKLGINPEEYYWFLLPSSFESKISFSLFLLSSRKLWINPEE